MSAGALIEDLRQRDVRLEVEGDSLLIDAPAGFVTEELRKNLLRLKPELLAILRWEKCGAERESERSNYQRLDIRWSEYPQWIELRDPITGEEHEVRASECLPGVVESANRRRRKEGAR